MSKKRKYVKPVHKENLQEEATVSAIDRVAAFRHFEETIAPALRAQLEGGKSAMDLYETYEKLAAARVITIVGTEQDSGKALAAAKELLDRRLGKSIERKETTHRLAGLRDEELNAYLATKIQDNAGNLLTEGDDDESESDTESEATE